MVKRRVSVPDPGRIRICGHRRTGNNYLMALLSHNFYGKKWIQFASTHKKIRHVPISQYHFYIYRNVKDTLASVFAMRDSFHIMADNYDEFLGKKYCEMIGPNSDVAVNVFRYNGERIVKSTAKPFAKVGMTPEDYYWMHLRYFFRFVRSSRMLLVSYDELRNNFRQEMLKIASFLGSPRKNFVDVNRKVGFYSLGEGKL